MARMKAFHGCTNRRSSMDCGPTFGGQAIGITGFLDSSQRIPSAAASLAAVHGLYCHTPAALHRGGSRVPPLSP